MNYKIIAGIFFIIISLTGSVLPSIDYDNNGSMGGRQKESLQNFIESYISGDKYKLEEININYSELSVATIEGGKILCQGLLKSSNNLSKDIIAALEKCDVKNANDDTRLILEFLSAPQLLEKYFVDDISRDFALGMDALRFEANGAMVTIPSYVPIVNNWSMQQTLEKACRQVGYPSSCFSNSSVVKTKYAASTVSYYSGNLDQLYHFNKLIYVSEISQDDLQASIANGYEWLVRDVDNETKLLRYQYEPSSGQYTQSNNYVRQLAATWASTELMDFFRREEMSQTIIKTLDEFMDYKKTNGNKTYFSVYGDSSIAFNAFAIMMLINTPDYPGASALAVELGDSVLAMQNDDGSFTTDFINGGRKGIDYYPGEAMLALMKLAGSTKQSKYSEAVEKALPYYRNYWRGNKNTAFVPWHTQAYKLLYEVKPTRDIVDFVFEMNDWLIDTYQQQVSTYPDYLGGFRDSPSNSTASYLEGLADAYSLAVKVSDAQHIAKYKKASMLATRFVMQTQYIVNNSFYLPNAVQALGGFRQSLTNNSQRNDYTQHSTLSLMKVYQNKIFN